MLQAYSPLCMLFRKSIALILKFNACIRRSAREWFVAPNCRRCAHDLALACSQLAVLRMFLSLWICNAVTWLRVGTQALPNSLCQLAPGVPWLCCRSSPFSQHRCVTNMSVHGSFLCAIRSVSAALCSEQVSLPCLQSLPVCV